MNRKMLVLTAISDSQGTKLQKELKKMVREKYHQTVAPVDADMLVLDDIRAMARQLNEQNPKCKPVEIDYQKHFGRHISWMEADWEGGQQREDGGVYANKQMVQKGFVSSAYAFKYDIVRDLFDIDFRRTTEPVPEPDTTQPRQTSIKELLPEEENPFV